jgi:amino-acid N-acetyltransferase
LVETVKARSAMHIEAASAGTYDEIEQLLSVLSLPTAGLRDQFPRAYAVAITRGSVVGCAGLEIYEDAGLLRSVAVVGAHQGTGIGRALVAERLAAAKRQGLEAVYLLTTTAAEFFVRLGFVPANRAEVPPALASSPEFASACPASAACLRLTF